MYKIPTELWDHGSKNEILIKEINTNICLKEETSEKKRKNCENDPPQYFTYNKHFNEVKQRILNIKKVDLFKTPEIQDSFCQLKVSKASLTNITSLFECQKDAPLIDSLSTLEIDTGIRPLNVIPESIERFQNLQKMSLLHVANDLKLPKTIGNLKNLEYLHIKNEKETYDSEIYIPESIGDLRNLKTLKIENYYLNKLPKSIKNLQKLTKLNLDRSNFSKLPSEIFELRELKKLSCFQCNLNNLSERIEDLAQLETLFLSNNKLQELPSTIWNLKNLIYLDVSNASFIGKNKIHVLPDATEELPLLEILDLEHIQLQKIPNVLNYAPNLKRVYMRANETPLTTIETFKF